MPSVSGLRSPYVRVGRLVYFGRMLDKIRLHAQGALPPDYVTNLGDAKPTVFDGRICRFLRVRFVDLQTQVVARPDWSDGEVLAWVEEQSVAAGHAARTDEECEIFNAFLSKRGWRDAGSAILAQRAAESAVTGKPIATMFDYIDFDEGRDPVAERAWEVKPEVIVVMGVAGAGKTTLGRALAARLGWAFLDADAFHPEANLAKLRAGSPLDDADRAPWLAALRARIEAQLAGAGRLVLACSALKQAYRDTLWVDRSRMRLVFLDGPAELVAARLAAREVSEPGHPLAVGMLASQLAALEPPADAVRVEVARTTPEQVAAVCGALGL
ncbi:MAG: gluconokinase, GntK/IdnK-type [Verrucomicrobia bacterium]|nr:gluconokinase, GntK/IdnK-type [Verrucomicrobiota bacterium]